MEWLRVYGSQRNLYSFFNPAANLHSRKVGGANFNFVRLDFVIGNFVYHALAFEIVNSFPGNGQHIVMAISNNVHVHVHVGQQCAIGVRDFTGDLAHSTRAHCSHSRRRAGERTLPGAAGQSIPCNLYFLSFRKLADVRLIDKRPNLHCAQVGHLHQQVASVYVRTCFNGQLIHNACEGSADI